MYCKKCKKNNINWVKTYDDGVVCTECANKMFVCPSCGVAYEQDDYENGDAGTGFCVKCEKQKC